MMISQKICSFWPTTKITNHNYYSITHFTKTNFGNSAHGLSASQRLFSLGSCLK